MRITAILLAALPAATLAQQQIPFLDKVQGWLNTAQGFVQDFASAPVDAAAARVARGKVQPLTLQNWKHVLSPSPGKVAPGHFEEWMIFVTGGNKTCMGSCLRADKAWNESVALLTLRAKDVQLARLDCEQQELLCGAWAVRVPIIRHMLIPAPLPDQSDIGIVIRDIRLNRTEVGVSDITEIHTKQKYLEEKPYDGIMHPFDGLLAKYGLTMPVAYVMFAISKIPSWLMMMAISLFSRNYMAKRMTGRRGPPDGHAPAARRPQ